MEVFWVLVVIGNFDFVGVAADPTEAQTPLVIDTDAVLTGTLAFERFKPVAGRDAEIFEGVGTGKHVEFVDRSLDQIGREAGSLTVPEFFGRLVAEIFNHKDTYSIFQNKMQVQDSAQLQAHPSDLSPIPSTFHFPEPTFTPTFRRDEQLWS